MKLGRRIFNATRQNNHEYLQELLDEAESANILNKDNETPLNIMCKTIVTEADIETIKILLRNSADILWPDIDNVTPAKYLLLTKDSSLIDLVLPKLLDMQVPLDPEKNTALHVAIEAGDEQTVSKLLKFHANPNTKNSEGFSSIHVAVRNSRHDFLKDMIDHGGDIDIPGPESLTPLHMVARMNSLESLKAVLAFKPKTEVLNNDQLTPLMELVTLNAFPPMYLIYELLEYGADPGFAKSNGYNCLHLWVDRKLEDEYISVFNFLLPLFIQYGLDINAVTVEQETALHIAIRKCGPLLVLSLLRYGSDLKMKSYNKMALDMALNRKEQRFLLCIITHIALKRRCDFSNINSVLKQYFINNYSIDIIMILKFLMNHCNYQLKRFKFYSLKGTNLSYYDVITKSTETLAYHMPCCLRAEDLYFRYDSLWTYRLLVFCKLNDVLNCRTAYRSIGLFLKNLFSQILKNEKSAEILFKLIVPYFKYHEAVKLQRRLDSVLDINWPLDIFSPEEDPRKGSKRRRFKKVCIIHPTVLKTREYFPN